MLPGTRKVTFCATLDAVLFGPHLGRTSRYLIHVIFASLPPCVRSIGLEVQKASRSEIPPGGGKQKK